MLMQLIEGALVGAGVLHGMTLARKKLVKKTISTDTSMEWKCVEYKLMNGKRGHGFCCPKCVAFFSYDFMNETKRFVLCSCPEYHKEHFHFECKCGYKNIMRTADDR